MLNEFERLKLGPKSRAKPKKKKESDDEVETQGDEEGMLEEPEEETQGGIHQGKKGKEGDWAYVGIELGLINCKTG